MTAEIFLALHTTTPGNSRVHWTKAARVTKMQREHAGFATIAMLRDNKIPRGVVPAKIEFIRRGRKMDKHNLPGAMKALVDGVADAIGVDDGDERYTFEFSQRNAKPHGVKIIFTF